MILTLPPHADSFRTFDGPIRSLYFSLKFHFKVIYCSITYIISIKIKRVAQVSNFKEISGIERKKKNIPVDILKLAITLSTKCYCLLGEKI